MIPYDSTLLQTMVSTDAMAEVWSEERMLSGWVSVERAVVQGQIELRLISEEAGAGTLAALASGVPDPDQIAAEARRAGHLMVGFLRALHTAGRAGPALHLGPTTQDVMDLTLVGQMREAQDLVDESLQGLLDVLCGLALEERSTPTMARTHGQHAMPTTFGFVLASWADELDAHGERMRQARQRWQVGGLGGAVGTQAAFVELGGESSARRLEQLVCRRLDLPTPDISNQTRLDRFAEATQVLALLMATLGRIALHLRDLQRPEIGEVSRSPSPDECNSSTMPNKRNPESLEQIQGLSQVVAGHASAVLATRLVDHRDGTRLPALLGAIPASFSATHRALTSLNEHLRTLVVNRDQMRRNLDHPSLFGQVACERVMVAAARRTGEKHEAHSRLSELADRSRREGRSMRSLIESDPWLGALFDEEELNQLFRLDGYLGTAPAQVDAVVRRIRGACSPSES